MQQPGMPPFSPAAGTPPPGVAQAQHAPSPISSRPPAEGQQQQVDELGGSASAGDHEAGMMMATAAAGDEGERGGPSGNRWPRQETLALLKIRSEMDAAFKEAALKGPLWDQVSRRLEAMGYKRSAKKCREKFENVDKYYKRTKDGRAGRGDGKAYRFFSELEALHGASSSSHPPAAATPVAMAPPAAVLTPVAMQHVEQQQPAPAAATSDAACMMTPCGDLSFSSGSDGEDTAEEAAGGEGGKRKRDTAEETGSRKMMRFFEGLMRQVMSRQEEMQQRFIEAMERREQERMIREEAWRRQEVARLAREQDALAQERAMAASRDAAVVSFIQRVTGQTIPMPSSVVPPAAFSISALTPPPPPPLQPTPVASAGPSPPIIHQLSPKPAQPQPQQAQMIRAAAAEDTSTTAAAAGGGSPSRWPKAEVHALIQLRTELEARYQDSGPKGPLWEDISAGMRRMGYSRSAKRCKEKWENINKYFKKVKESNKKRPEDSKTCPYYHQLDALYRSKQAAAPPAPQAAGVTVLAAVPLSQNAPHAEHQGNNGNGNGCAGRAPSDNNGGSMQTQGVASRLPVQGNGVAPNKQQEGGITMKETAAEPRPQPVSMNDSYVNDNLDSDSSMDDDDDEEEDDLDDDDEGNATGGSKMQHYEIQFQRQQQQSQTSVVRPPASGGAASGPCPAATTSGSFLTMVHH